MYAHTHMYIRVYVFSIKKFGKFSKPLSSSNLWCHIWPFKLVTSSLKVLGVTSVSCVESFSCPKVYKVQRGLIIEGYQALGCSFAASHICNFSFFFFFFGYKTVCAGFLSDQFRLFLLSV